MRRLFPSDYFVFLGRSREAEIRGSRAFCGYPETLASSARETSFCFPRTILFSSDGAVRRRSEDLVSRVFSSDEAVRRRSEDLARPMSPETLGSSPRETSFCFPRTILFSSDGAVRRRSEDLARPMSPETLGSSPRETSEPEGNKLTRPSRQARGRQASPREAGACLEVHTNFKCALVCRVLVSKLHVSTSTVFHHS